MFDVTVRGDVRGVDTRRDLHQGCGELVDKPDSVSRSTDSIDAKV